MSQIANLVDRNASATFTDDQNACKQLLTVLGSWLNQSKNSGHAPAVLKRGLTNYALQTFGSVPKDKSGLISCKENGTF
jgi:hypothetical protein